MEPPVLFWKFPELLHDARQCPDLGIGQPVHFKSPFVVESQEIIRGAAEYVGKFDQYIQGRITFSLFIGTDQACGYAGPPGELRLIPVIFKPQIFKTCAEIIHPIPHFPLTVYPKYTYYGWKNHIQIV